MHHKSDGLTPKVERLGSESFYSFFFFGWEMLSRILVSLLRASSACTRESQTRENCLHILSPIFTAPVTLSLSHFRVTAKGLEREVVHGLAAGSTDLNPTQKLATSVNFSQPASAFVCGVPCDSYLTGLLWD